MILKEVISLHGKFLRRGMQLGVRNLWTSKALYKSYYETLGVKPDATLAEIKNAYFELSKIYHPDRIAATDENLAKFREINNAYEILGNEHSRKLYDRGLIDVKGGLDAAESDDPIVKFYKQKQEMSRTVKSQAAEMDAWTQTYYKEARKKVLQQNELFADSKAKGKEKDDWFYYFVALVTILAMNVVLMSNLENHPIERFKRKLLGSL